MKYTFDNRIFNSKKAVDTYIRDVKNDFVNTHNNLVIDSGHKLFPFFKEIVDVHNEKDDKIGCGIEFFYFIKDYYGKDQLRICRTDKSTIDCSYMYSKITQRCEPINYKDDLNNALRDAIKYQIFDFFDKQEKPLRCCLCGSMGKCEIDHIIPFHHIKNEYLKEIDDVDIPTQFEDDINGTCSRIFRQTDSNFKEKWQLFHNSMATYQVLCKQCNRKKSGKYINE